jgi:hypothetical protein
VAPPPPPNGQAPRANGQPPPAAAGHPPPTPDQQLDAFLRQILDPAIGCAEVRLLTKAIQDKSGYIVPEDRFGSIMASWFTEANEIICEAHKLKGVSGYITANPVHPDLLALGHNKLEKQPEATKKEDVVVLRNALIDLDPQRRKKGISATERERRASLECRDRILAEEPEIAAASIWLCSGNGGQILVKLLDLPNDEKHVAMVKRFLETLASRYSGTYDGVEVTVDTTTYEPNQLMALVGTWKCKGKHTTNRPYRRITIDSPLDKQRTPLDLKAWLDRKPPVTPATEDNGQAPSSAKSHPSASRAKAVSSREATRDDDEAPGRRPGGAAAAVSDQNATRDDDEVVRVALKSKGFAPLWGGHWEGTYRSQSEADEGLCSRLAFYCGPRQEEQVRRLFLRSGLGGRAKADRTDYLDRTVSRAYEGRTEYFRWNRAGNYFERDGKLYYDGGDDGPIELMNFSARITETITRFQAGKEINRFRIEAEHPDPDISLQILTVDATDFLSGAWIARLPANFAVAAGRDRKDHARFGVQLLSQAEGIESIDEHTALGWITHNDQNFYIHSGGAIGPAGPSDAVRVEIGGTLTKYHLPSPPTDPSSIRDAVEAHLAIWELGKENKPASRGVAAIVAMLPCRAVLGHFDASIHLGGPSGNRKTSVARLILQHFSTTTRGREAPMPAGWNSSPSNLQGLSYDCRDAPLIVDDLKTNAQIETAELTFTAQANLQGRGRMSGDQTLQANLDPRGSLLSTGEIDPRSASTLGRLFVIEIGAGDIDLDVLTRFQEAGDKELYALAMAAYIRWLAPRLDEIRTRHKRLTAEIRDALPVIEGVHPRHPDIAAQLLAGYQHFLEFAVEIGAIAPLTGAAAAGQARACMIEVLKNQAEPQEEAKIGRQFVEAVANACAAGRCYLEAIDGSGSPPYGLELACGWRVAYQYQGSDVGRLREWVFWPNARRVGFVDVEAGAVFLIPGEAISAANDEMRRLTKTTSFAKVGRELIAEKLCQPAQEGEKKRADVHKRIFNNGNKRYFQIDATHLFGEISDEPQEFTPP